MVDRRLTVLRHAKSDWPDGVADFDRPLAERGEADAPAAGRWLAAEQLLPALIVCSPAVRAQRTCELVAVELPTTTAQVDDRLYAASAGDLLDVVHQLDVDIEHAMLIGHNPGLSTLISVLTGERVELKTSGIAVATWSGAWSDAAPSSARLVASATPRG